MPRTLTAAPGRLLTGTCVCSPLLVAWVAAEYRTEVDKALPQVPGGQLPLDSIFAKSQLDQLVADAWLQSEWKQRTLQRLLVTSGFTTAGFAPLVVQQLLFPYKLFPSVCRGLTKKLPAAGPVTTCPVPAATCALPTADNPPAMVQQILSLSEKRNIPVSGFTVAVGFETTPQRMDQMQVRLHTAALILGHCKVVVHVGAWALGLAGLSCLLAPGAAACWVHRPTVVCCVSCLSCAFHTAHTGHDT